MARRIPSPDPLKRTKSSFHSMHSRCNDLKNKYYGGKGIRVCKRWASFENFVADMGLRPEWATIDRWPNENGNYEPGNCRWATDKQQGWTVRGRESPRTTLMLQRRHDRSRRRHFLKLWERCGYLYGVAADVRLQQETLAGLEEEFGEAVPELPKSFDADNREAGNGNVECEHRHNQYGMTLEEVAAALGCTREYVRQIEEIALGKLLLALRAVESGKPVRRVRPDEARRALREAHGLPMLKLDRKAA